MAFLDSLHQWQNFFIVTGGAAASLVGLMFVSLSLGSHLVNDQTEADIRTYVNPMLVHLGIVLVVSCTMLVPTHTTVSLAVIVGLCGIAGSREVLHAARGMPLRQAKEDHHWIWHFLLPLLSYIAGCAVTVGLIVSGLPTWLNGLALMVVTLLMCSIRNMWVLVLWVVRQH